MASLIELQRALGGGKSFLINEVLERESFSSNIDTGMPCFICLEVWPAHLV